MCLVIPCLCQDAWFEPTLALGCFLLAAPHLPPVSTGRAAGLEGSEAGGPAGGGSKAASCCAAAEHPLATALRRTGFAAAIRPPPLTAAAPPAAGASGNVISCGSGSGGSGLRRRAAVSPSSPSSPTLPAASPPPPAPLPSSTPSPPSLPPQSPPPSPPLWLRPVTLLLPAPVAAEVADALAPPEATAAVRRAAALAVRLVASGLPLLSCLRAAAEADALKAAEAGAEANRPKAAAATEAPSGASGAVAPPDTGQAAARSASGSERGGGAQRRFELLAAASAWTAEAREALYGEGSEDAAAAAARGSSGGVGSGVGPCRWAWELEAVFAAVEGCALDLIMGSSAAVQRQNGGGGIGSNDGGGGVGSSSDGDGNGGGGIKRSGLLGGDDKVDGSLPPWLASRYAQRCADNGKAASGAKAGLAAWGTRWGAPATAAEARRWLSGLEGF